MDRETQKRLLAFAYRQARKSQDPSTQNGAVLVEPDGWAKSDGYNRLPEGIASTPERWQKPLKSKVVLHAELTAILEAAKQGVRLQGLTLVAPLLACTGCARAILAAGIRRCIGHKQRLDASSEDCKAEVAQGLALLTEAGVEVVWYDGPIGGDSIRVNGEEFQP